MLLQPMAEADVLGLVGSTIDQIRFDACVDTGGFGIIYRAHHLVRNEPVAIKCLRLTQLLKMDEEIKKQITGRFDVETKILMHLSQGNHDIVNCYASGELFSPTTKERVPYMVLEWLEGRTLGVDLEDRKARGLGGRTLSDALDLMESAALAISYAHTQGVVHRDIKPANLLLASTRSGVRLKVLDFGLAKILGGESTIGQGVATMSGLHLCSPEYASPEQFASNVGPMGPWTDVYSLALVLLEVMRGEPVRKVHTLADALMAALDPKPNATQEAMAGLGLPQPIQDLLARALSKQPLERPNSVGMFWTGLRELARRNVKPIADASALAATAYGGDVTDALARVRQAQQAQHSQGPQQPSAVPGGSKRQAFTGTLLMVNAPDGGLQRLEPMKTEEPQGSTAPLHPPAHRSSTPNPFADVSPTAATVPGQVPSPLATSGVVPPVSPIKRGSIPPINPASGGQRESAPTASDAYRPTQPANQDPGGRGTVAMPPPQQNAGPAPMGQMQPSVMPLPTTGGLASVPPPPPVTRGPGLALAIIVAVLLVGGLVAAVLLLRH